MVLILSNGVIPDPIETLAFISKTIKGIESPISAPGLSGKLDDRCLHHVAVVLASRNYKVIVPKKSSDTRHVLLCLCYVSATSLTKKKINEAVLDAYRYCFASYTSNMDTIWVPYAVSITCYVMLIKCYNDKHLHGFKSIKH